ncbi:MAG: DNA methyltransferase, partial [Spirochaetaceae bacterium]
MNYLQDQLIAYIGNKRTLLPFLESLFLQYSGHSKDISFYDPFAGAGAVSRLAKSMGFSVHSNDWEYYSYVINQCFVGVNGSELDSMFADFGGAKGI